MANLIYSTITSLDGYVADEQGNFDWGEPDGEVHSFINELEREVGIYLYGRRMYEIMAIWEDFPTDEAPAWIAEYAGIWRAAEKVVYSSTLDSASTPKTRIERSFEPEAVRRMKAAAGRDIGIGGTTIAAQALKAGLVEVYQLFVLPVVLGGGKKALPEGLKLKLRLVDERRFGNGTVFLDYRIERGEASGS